MSSFVLVGWMDALGFVLFNLTKNSLLKKKKKKSKMIKRKKSSEGKTMSLIKKQLGIAKMEKQMSELCVHLQIPNG